MPHTHAYTHNQRRRDTTTTTPLKTETRPFIIYSGTRQQTRSPTSGIVRNNNLRCQTHTHTRMEMEWNVERETHANTRTRTPMHTRTCTSKAKESRQHNRRHRASGLPRRPLNVKSSVSAIQTPNRSIMLSVQSSFAAIPPTTHTCTCTTHSTTRRDATNVKKHLRTTHGTDHMYPGMPPDEHLRCYMRRRHV